MKKKEKKNLPKVSEEKKEGERSSDSTRKGQKCNGRLMYKTKGVEPNPRFEMTHGRVSTSQTLIYPLLPPPSQSIFVF